LTDPVKPGKKQHQVHYYLDLARAISDLPSVPTIRLWPTADGATQARELLASVGVAPDNRFMVLNPGGAFGGAKRWGADRFAECADKLAAEFDLEVVIIGSEAERPIAEDVRSRMSRWAAVLNGKTDLDILMSVLAQSKLVITNDSGPMHLAAALGAPTVAIFGATDDTATGPWGPHTRVVREPVDCSPCMLRECPIDHRCMTRVTADAVCGAAREVIRS
jgi:heptosyltransferase-2